MYLKASHDAMLFERLSSLSQSDCEDFFFHLWLSCHYYSLPLSTCLQKHKKTRVSELMCAVDACFILIGDTNGGSFTNASNWNLLIIQGPAFPVVKWLNYRNNLKLEKGDFQSFPVTLGLGWFQLFFAIWVLKWSNGKTEKLRILNKNRK